MTHSEKLELVRTAQELGESKLANALARMSPEQKAMMIEALQEAPAFCARVLSVVGDRVREDTKNLPQLAEATLNWAAKIGDLFDDE